MLALIKIIFCFSLLLLANFIQIPLMQYDYQIDSLVVYNYCPLYITAFTLSLFFKNNYAIIAILLYITLGLSGLPLFAYGGGWQYIFQPSFGYILGLVPLSVIAFYFKYHLHDANDQETHKQKNLFSLWSIVTAHILGLIFLAFSARLNLHNFVIYTVYPIPYDLIFGLIAVIVSPVYNKKVFS